MPEMIVRIHDSVLSVGRVKLLEKLSELNIGNMGVAWRINQIVWQYFVAFQ